MKTDSGNFNIARFQVRILCALFSQAYLSLNFNDIFFLKEDSLTVIFAIDFRVEYHLSDSTNVPQMDKQNISMVPDGIHPTHETDFLPFVGRSQISTINSLFPIHMCHHEILRK